MKKFVVGLVVAFLIIVIFGVIGSLTHNQSQPSSPSIASHAQNRTDTVSQSKQIQDGLTIDRTWAENSAESVDSAVAKCLPLRDCELTEERDLGVWDDVFVCDGQDMIALRRGEALFSLSMTGSADPRELAKASVLTKTQIVASATAGERLWLFLQSTETSPFAIDAYSGKVSGFKIPNLRIPGNHTPGIQSHVIVRHADAALLMIAGGDRDTWPRDGNRPVYFWMDLSSGEVVRFPIGWDLEYFSANQRVAVFEGPHKERFQRRPLHAVNIETGGLVDRIPDRRKEACVPFNWTETQEVKPLYVRHAETGDREHFAGISLRGLVLPFDLHLRGTHYLSTAEAKGEFAGLRLRREGAIGAEPSPFWIVGLKQGQSPEHVAAAITDFAMLKTGNCVYATTGHGPKGTSSEAFFRIHSDKFTWNILDGVKRLPELAKQFVDKDYVEDKLTVRFVDGLGDQKYSPLVLCLFTHIRMDRRSLILPPQGKRLERMTWRRVIIVTSDGKRFMTDLFREGKLPNEIWFHNSGKVFMGNYLWQSSGDTRERKVQLSETTLRLEQK